MLMKINEAYFKERSVNDFRKTMLFTKEELRERESRCTYESPPHCAAVCPMKVDVRALAEHIASGDLSKARNILEMATPLHGLLAAACEAPCEAACRMKEVGDPISIGALERAAMRYGSAKSGIHFLKRKKSYKVAIFGASLFTLGLAAELEAKSFPVSFFVPQRDVDELFRALLPQLDPKVVEAEAKSYAALDIDFTFGASITPQLLSEKRAEGERAAVSRELAAQVGATDADPVTLYCEKSELIAEPPDCAGVLRSLFDARRAAATVQRLSQGVDPHSMRDDEGTTESKLYTDMSGASTAPRVVEPEGGYTEAQAIEEAKRCHACRCEECMKACVYLQHHKTYPKLLMREIYNNTSIIMGTHSMNKAMNSCAECGQCKVVCPTGFDMGDICNSARLAMVSTDKLSLAVHEFALYDMLFSNDEGFLSRGAPGIDSCKWVFFPGCQAAAVSPDTVEAAYRDLSARLDGGVGLMLGCCGQIAKWAGRDQLYEDQKKQLVDEWNALGRPKPIAACPTCRTALAEIFDTEVDGVWSVLAEIGLPSGASCSGTAHLHDACGARGDSETQSAVRKIAQSLGVSLKEDEWREDRSKCCGYGGLMAYANRELANEMARDTIRADEDDGLPHVTYCMACRDRYARAGVKSSHLLELVYGTSGGTAPDLSEKRRNRIALKQRLLESVWGEKALAHEDIGFTVTFTDEARAMMDDRMILDTDVIATLKDSRESGMSVENRETGKLVARHRIGNVTFWVEFTEVDGGCRVEGAYSHRMAIEPRWKR